jgi:23S rRNA maturation mini-RNase III
MFRCKSGGCKGSKYKKPSESEKVAKAKADTLLEEILAKRREDEDTWLKRGREWNPSDQTKPSPEWQVPPRQ